MKSSLSGRNFLVIVLAVIFVVFIPSIISVFLVFAPSLLEGDSAKKALPVAKEGVLDLRSWSLEEDDLLILDGEWEFYWNQLLKPEDFYNDNNENVLKTGEHKKIQEIWDDYGYATYRLTILLDEEDGGEVAILFPYVRSSYKVWGNGELLGENGNVETSENNYTAKWKNDLFLIFLDNSKLELVMQAENYHLRSGGIKNFQFGSQDTITLKRENHIVQLFLFIGAFLLLGIYHINLYIIWKKNISSALFGIICFLIIIVIIFDGELTVLFPDVNINFESQIKVFYLSIFTVIGIFFLYLRSLYPEEISKKLLLYISYPVIFCLLIILAMPFRIYSALDSLFLVVFIVVAVVIINRLYHGLKYRRQERFIYIASILTMVAIALNDTLNSYQIIDTFYSLPYGIFLIILLQAILLAQRYADSYDKIEQLSHSLIATNIAYSRFVPKELLSYLGKDDITKINIGDQVSVEMTLLYSDIRSFSSLSEKMTSQECFDFLNGYLDVMGPIIRKNNGFINKYIGDAIMALFPRNPDDAINTAIEMQQKLNKYNDRRSDKEPLKMGIGIHKGPMIMGTIGETDRMEGTVISDVVAATSQIEELTKKYDASIIISRSALDSLLNPQKFHTKYLGLISTKGQDEGMEIYEVLYGYKPQNFRWGASNILTPENDV